MPSDDQAKKHKKKVKPSHKQQDHGKNAQPHIQSFTERVDDIKTRLQKIEKSYMENNALNQPVCAIAYGSMHLVKAANDYRAAANAELALLGDAMEKLKHKDKVIKEMRGKVDELEHEGMNRKMVREYTQKEHEKEVAILKARVLYEQEKHERLARKFDREYQRERRW